MAVSGDKIKAMRDAKAWSQAHLAEAAGLSLRTVQRVEAEGTASAETRLAIAGALGVSVEALNAAAPAVEAQPRSGEPDPGPFNTAVMLSTVGAALLYVLWMGGRLPPQVASHFGIANDANATMSRDAFVASMCGVMVGLPLLVWAALGWAMKRHKVNIPNAAYWFSEPRRRATERYLFRHFTWLGVGMTVFSGYMLWLVVAANLGAPAHPVLDGTRFTVGLGVFLALTTAWATALSLRFRMPDSGTPRSS
jgi:transcriptional regulator with XRE-family HTH domain